MFSKLKATKDKIVFTTTSRESNGELSILLTEVKSGGGPPLHYHKVMSQTFKVLEGELHLTVRNKVHVIKAGESYEVPPMVPHSQASEKGRLLKCLVEIRPGHQGYEDFMNMTYNDPPGKYTEQQKQEIYLNADTYKP